MKRDGQAGRAAPERRPCVTLGDGGHAARGGTGGRMGVGDPVASGGHAPDAVLLMRNIGRDVARTDISLMDVAPTIVDLLGIDRGGVDFDGASILEP